MKKCIITLLLLLTAIAGIQGRDLKAEPDLSHNLWWNAPETPCINIVLTDTVGVTNHSLLEFFITKDTDENNRVFSVAMPINLETGVPDTLSFDVATLQPGFYKCFVKDDGNLIKRFNIGYEPTNIVSLPDAPADFNEFWAST